MASASSAAPASVASLADAARRWQLGASDVTAWRTRMMATRTAAAPAGGATSALPPSEGQSRAEFLESLRLRQLAAETRVQQLKESAEDTQADAKEEEDQEDEEEEEDDEESEESSGSSSEEEGESSYENELSYFVHELLCVDAISHEAPSGAEVQCPYCQDGRKFESEFACSTCAFVRGVCASCRKVVVLRSLEDPAKGAAVCLALLSDPALLATTLELDAKDDADELQAIRGQITFMLDAYFDQAKAQK